ncbi:transposase [Cohnella fermenti]|nr:transposase [Cohnella fermenti]
MFGSYAEYLTARGGEAACLAYFIHCRWPEGFHCPLCGHRSAYTITTRRMPLYECVRCRLQTSVTSGTCMEGTRTPLSKWLIAMERMGDPQSGINAVQLAKLINVTYKTAYSMMNKIRESLLGCGTTLLSGRIEAGLAVFGTPGKLILEIGDRQQPLAIATEIDDSNRPKRMTWVMLERGQMNGRCMIRDTWREFKHQCFASDPVSQANEVHRSWFLTVRHCRTMTPIIRKEFQRIQTTYHGIGLASLPKYLAESVFRWNALQNEEDLLRLTVQACQSSCRAERSDPFLRLAC